MASRHFATACTRMLVYLKLADLQGIQKVLTDCLVAHSSWFKADGTLCDNFTLVSSCKAEALQFAAVITLSKVLITPDDWEYFGHHAAAQCLRHFVDSTHKRMGQWMATAVHPAMPIPYLHPYMQKRMGQWMATAVHPAMPIPYLHPYMQIICKLLQSHISHVLPIVYCLCLLHLHGLFLSSPPDVVTVPL